MSEIISILEGGNNKIVKYFIDTVVKNHIYICGHQWYWQCILLCFLNNRQRGEEVWKRSDIQKMWGQLNPNTSKITIEVYWRRKLMSLRQAWRIKQKTNESPLILGCMWPCLALKIWKLNEKIGVIESPLEPSGLQDVNLHSPPPWNGTDTLTIKIWLLCYTQQCL